jgi:DNA-binding MarR family transcriptional regulator
MIRGASGRHDARSRLLTDVILLLFHVNGQLLAAGDRLVADLHLTSARWQMLGAVALSDSPRTAPQLAIQMGVTRQGAQKQLDLLLKAGLVMAEANPGHARSPLYTLTRKGTSIYVVTERIQATWAKQLARKLPMSDLEAAKRLLEELSGRLSTT